MVRDMVSCYAMLWDWIWCDESFDNSSAHDASCSIVSVLFYSFNSFLIRHIISAYIRDFEWEELSPLIEWYAIFTLHIIAFITSEESFSISENILSTIWFSPRLTSICTALFVAYRGRNWRARECACSVTVLGPWLPCTGDPYAIHTTRTVTTLHSQHTLSPHLTDNTHCHYTTRTVTTIHALSPHRTTHTDSQHSLTSCISPSPAVSSAALLTLAPSPLGVSRM